MLLHGTKRNYDLYTSLISLHGEFTYSHIQIYIFKLKIFLKLTKKKEKNKERMTKKNRLILQTK